MDVGNMSEMKMPIMEIISPGLEGVSLRLEGDSEADCGSIVD